MHFVTAHEGKKKNRDTSITRCRLVAATMSTSGGWSEQIPCSKMTLWGFSRTNTIPLNSKEIFCASSSFGSADFWIYNIPKLEWRFLQSFKTYPRDNQIMFQKEEQLIYFLTDTGIAVYDLISNSIQEYDNVLTNYRPGNTCICTGAALQLIEHKLQVIMGSFHDKHIEYDIEKKQCKELYQFKKYQDGLSEAASIYLQNKGESWLMGGYDCDPCALKPVDDVHLYSIKNNKWKLLDIKLPVPLCDCTCVCTKDERFIIIFGGEDSSDVLTANIFIIDTELLEIKESSIKCPMSDAFSACLVDETERSDLIITGFINECWTEEKFKNDDNLRYPSNDIIRVILLFHSEQMVHLFKRYRAKGHWQIYLIHLLISKKESNQQTASSTD